MRDPTSPARQPVIETSGATGPARNKDHLPMTSLVKRAFVRAAALLPISALLIGLEVWLAAIIDDHVSATILVMILSTLVISLAMPILSKAR